MNRKHFRCTQLELHCNTINAYLNRLYLVKVQKWPYDGSALCSKIIDDFHIEMVREYWITHLSTQGTITCVTDWLSKQQLEIFQDREGIDIPRVDVNYATPWSYSYIHWLG